MDNITFSLSIPLDEDGFLEMECDYCKERFMLSKETFEGEDNLDFFCPICGLPNIIYNQIKLQSVNYYKYRAIFCIYVEIDKKHAIIKMVSNLCSTCFSGA